MIGIRRQFVALGETLSRKRYSKVKGKRLRGQITPFHRNGHQARLAKELSALTRRVKCQGLMDRRKKRARRKELLFL
jgi:hypothetical protein